MDPFTLLGLVGAGMSFGGSIGSLFGSSKANDEKMKQAQLQMQIEAKRRQAMELNARRQQTENLRNTQLQRSMAITSATAQGAQFGSGLAGGLAQVSGQGYWNSQGISHNLALGQDIFGLNAQISQSKLAEGSYGSQAAMYQGISSMGSSLFNVSGKLGNIFGSTGGSSNAQTNWGPTYGDAINMMGRGAIY